MKHETDNLTPVGGNVPILANCILKWLQSEFSGQAVKDVPLSLRTSLKINKFTVFELILILSYGFGSTLLIRVKLVSITQGFMRMKRKHPAVKMMTGTIFDKILPLNLINVCFLHNSYRLTEGRKVHVNLIRFIRH